MALWSKKKKSPNKHHESGVAAFESGEFNDALGHFNKAIEIEPSSERHYYRGVIFDIIGSPREAIKDLIRSTKLDPENFQAWYSMSIIHAQQENPDAAFEAVKNAHRLAPDDFRIVNHFAMLLAESPITEHRNLEQAIKLSKHACELTEWKDKICIATHERALALAGKTDKAKATPKKSTGDTVILDAEETVVSFNLTSELIRHVEARFKRKVNELALQNIVPATIPIAVQTIESPKVSGQSFIFTTGVSAQKIQNPAGDSFRAELCMVIPGDWKVGNKIDEKIWPWQVLQQLGNIGHTANRGLSKQPSVVSVSNKPTPLGQDTEFMALLLLPNVKGYVDRLTTKSGEKVNFILAVPIYAEEFALAKKQGAMQLFKRFRESKTKPHFIPARKNLAV